MARGKRAPETVAEVIGEPEGKTPEPNLEFAEDSLDAITLGAEKPDNAAPPADRRGNPKVEPPPSGAGRPAPTFVAKPRRQTKAELEQKVAELEDQVARAAATAPSVIEQVTPALSLTFMAVGKVLAAWRGEHWNLLAAECDQLGKAWAPIVGPAIADKPELALWAGAISMTYAVVYPRLSEDKRLAVLAEKARLGEEASTAEVVEESPNATPSK